MSKKVRDYLSGHLWWSSLMESIFKIIRVRKEDSAFIYFILESYEGIASYSTLEHRTGEAYRDLELRIAPDFIEEVKRVLHQLGEMVYELEETG